MENTIIICRGHLPSGCQADAVHPETLLVEPKNQRFPSVARMSDRLLTNIIEQGKALQAEVEQEEARASAWCERELAALEQELTSTRQ